MGAPTKISTHDVGDVASDGAGGLGVLTKDSGGTLRFASYDGSTSTWSAEATVGTSPVPVLAYHLAHSGALWGAAITPTANGSDPPFAWIDAAGTWTRYSPGVSSIMGFAGTGGTFAMSAIDGKVAVFTTTWNVTPVTTAVSADTQLAAYGNGYVFYQAGVASLFDGAAWSAPTSVGVLGAGAPLVSGATIALVGGGSIAAYSGASWSAAAIGTSATAVIEGGDVVAAFATPGAMNAQTRSGGTWGSSMVLPVYATSGPAVFGTMARASNGHALAVWSQYDNAALAGFAAEYDGCTWGAPVSILEVLGTASVAATASTFVVADTGDRRVGVWNGSGLGAYTMMGNVPLVASDGTSFVAVWDLGETDYYATSADGLTWTPMQTLGAIGYLQGLAGGPAGVLAWAVSASGTTASALVWHGGAWSVVGTQATASLTGCRGTVATSTALVACATSTQPTVQLFANGAWSASAAGDASFVIASDGTDYRMDYALATAMRSSTVLHDGAWSAPVTSSILPTLNIAGHAGTWSALGTSVGTDGKSHYVLETAAGDGAYGAPTVLPDPLVLAYSVAPFVNAGGETDAVLVDGHPAMYRGVSALFVMLGP